jgi:hypothetical protein
VQLIDFRSVSLGKRCLTISFFWPSLCADAIMHYGLLQIFTACDISVIRSSSSSLQPDHHGPDRLSALLGGVPLRMSSILYLFMIGALSSVSGHYILPYPHMYRIILSNSVPSSEDSHVSYVLCRFTLACYDNLRCHGRISVKAGKPRERDTQFSPAIFLNVMDNFAKIQCVTL